jgi:recombination protein RecA
MGALDAIIKDVNKAFGEGTLLRASDAKSLVVDRLKTGVFDLDIKLGGGLPRGRIITYKGGYSTGKSAIAMMNVAQAQSTCRFCGDLFEHVDFMGEYHSYSCKCGKKEPMRCVWLDAEHSFDPSWGEKWDVDTDALYIIQTEFAEQAIDITDRCIRSKECDLVVVDSVAALTPGVEVEEDSTKWQVGVFARLMNKALRKWTSGMNSLGLLSETKCTIILINQERMSIGGYRPSLTSPGGKGIDFFESVEVRFKRNEVIEDKIAGRPIGIEVEFTVKKNKTAPLTQPGIFSLYFVTDAGRYKVGSTDTDHQVLRLAIYWELVKKGGAWLTFPDGSRFQGMKKAAAALRDDPELLADLKDKVTEREVNWMQKGRSTDAVTQEIDGDEEAEAEDGVDGF